MWKRFNSQPASVDTSRAQEYADGYDDGYDDRYLETIHEVESIRGSRPVSTAALPELPLYVQLGRLHSGC